MSSLPDPTDHILVIEDNRPNRELMVYLLNAFDYVTREADNGRTGVELIREQRPMLIVCDIQMPQLDGYGVIRELKADDALKNIPIVAVTALAMVGDRDRVLAAGFDGYIAKPIAPDTFIEEIEKYLPAGKRLARNIEPRDDPPAAGAAPPSAPAVDIPPAVEPRHEKIVVVDDTPANLDFLRTTLESSGYEVVTAATVDQALERTHEGTPDAILSDLHMEVQSGLDFLSIAKADPVLKSIPFIIISSTYTGAREAFECVRRGAARFIIRPIGPEALLREIAAALKATRA